jgi:hypothetical protein
LPAIVAEQDNVEVPEPPAIDVEDIVQDMLVELVVIARATVPEKPFTGTTTTVEMPVTPAFTVTLGALAVTVKSWTWDVTITVWERPPFVLVTVVR